MLEKTERVLIAGCGDVGTALGLRLVEAGHRVWGLRRNIEALPAAIRPLAGDLSRSDGLPALPPDLDVVVYAAAAGRSDAEHYQTIYVDGLRHILDRVHASAHRPRRVLFTSSTGVYGQRDGEAVDESSPTKPRGFRGELMLEAERVLAESGLPGVVLRLGGIYGPGRTRLIRRALSGEPWQVDPPLFTNRIHRDDCARSIEHLLQLDTPQPLYVGVDHASVPIHEVMGWICEQLGRPLPSGSITTAPRGSGKRISSDRLRKSGFEFLYPNFREGYRELIEAYRTSEMA